MHQCALHPGVDAGGLHQPERNERRSRTERRNRSGDMKSSLSHGDEERKRKEWQTTHVPIVHQFTSAGRTQGQRPGIQLLLRSDRFYETVCCSENTTLVTKCTERCHASSCLLTWCHRTHGIPSQSLDPSRQ
ncbi:hypothetical protein Baya_11535 [Bagarius yarrelli]|uniref:Uncharacterized protein n=1 Tax=Bagarius yarrelli TaxID=175774 RepID=A0A556UZJ6_BAGYA|nr:hypothetical protein Baya_11535 [Bagarius yarrelli]